MHALSTTLDRLRGTIPAPSVRETSFWQSETIKLPEENRLQRAEDEGMGDVPRVAQEGEDVIPSSDDARQQQVPGGGKVKRKRPDPYQLTILHAMQTAQNAIPAIVEPRTTTADAVGVREVMTKEEEMAERLMRMVREPVGEPVGEVRDGVGGGGGGVKRAVDDGVRGIAKQARFQI